MNVYSSFIHNNLNWKTTRCPSMSEWLNAEYYSAINKKWTIDTYKNGGESPENYAEWKKPTPKGYIPQDTTYIFFLNDKIIEMEDRLADARGWGGHGGGKCGIWGILMLTEMFYNLTVLMSISQLWYRTTVLQYVNTRGNWVKGTQSLCTIS